MIDACTGEWVAANDNRKNLLVDAHVWRVCTETPYREPFVCGFAEEWMGRLRDRFVYCL
jgi:hypothetical protein